MTAATAAATTADDGSYAYAELSCRVILSLRGCRSAANGGTAQKDVGSGYETFFEEDDGRSQRGYRCTQKTRPRKCTPTLQRRMYQAQTFVASS